MCKISKVQNAVPLDSDPEFWYERLQRGMETNSPPVIRGHGEIHLYGDGLPDLSGAVILHFVEKCDGKYIYRIVVPRSMTHNDHLAFWMFVAPTDSDFPGQTVHDSACTLCIVHDRRVRYLVVVITAMEVSEGVA